MMIAEFKSRKIELTWTLLLICYNSNDLLKNCQHEKRFVGGDEIINYATNLLSETDDCRIVSLAILGENEQEMILDLLQQLSGEEKCDYSVEFRKFRAMYVHKNLPSTNDDFIQGILRITEIWDHFNFPGDSPNVYYKFKDYSLANFRKLLKINSNWVNEEFIKLKCSDS